MSKRKSPSVPAQQGEATSSSSSRCDEEECTRAAKRARLWDSVEEYEKRIGMASPAVSQAIDPVLRPWEWMASIRDGELVREIPETHPCAGGCYLTARVQSRLFDLLLRSTKVGHNSLSIGLRHQFEGVCVDMTGHPDNRVWDSSLPVGDFVAMSSMGLRGGLRKMPLRMSADTVYGILTSRPGESVVMAMMAGLWWADRKNGHAVVLLFSLTPFTDATEAPASFTTMCAGSVPERRIYALPIDFLGTMMRPDDYERGTAGSGPGSGSLTRQRVLSSRVALSNFLNILCKTRYDEAGNATVHVAKNDAGIVLEDVPGIAEGCGDLGGKLPADPLYRAASSSAVSSRREGTVRGNCTTLNVLLAALMVATRTTTVTVASHVLARMGTCSRIGFNRMLDRISFNAMRMFGRNDDECCDDARDPAHGGFTVGGADELYGAKSS